MKSPTLAELVGRNNLVQKEVMPILKEHHKENQKAARFEGKRKVFHPSGEEIVPTPDETQVLERRAGIVLDDIERLYATSLDATWARDDANAQIREDIVIDGETIVAQATPPFLIYFEKHLRDLADLIDKIPTLPPGQWTWDRDAVEYRGAPEVTVRTQKQQRPIVLFPATAEHPAQTQLISEDVPIGRWETTKSSGALSLRDRRALLGRINKLIEATVQARNRAAAQRVPQPAPKIGQAVYDYLKLSDIGG